MLFNSFEFLLAFLPVALIGFFSIGSRSRAAAAWWLAGASIVFYAGWSWRYVPLLLGSVAFNFAAGVSLAKLRIAGRTAAARAILLISVASNLALLAYYKYADFFISNVNLAAGLDLPLLRLILPLGISFFTFTQIAFLVDTYRGVAVETRFAHYLLFVTYFPHLIAGPVLHHKEMMPQFGLRSTYRFQWGNFAIGMSIFAIGLFKKTVLADGIAADVAPVFAAAERSEQIHLLAAWGGALSYSMQLYFDFSGYSDMAIGLSRLFGISLPLNFNSPYKARNISEFWRRWHMTLSRFLRDYLYISLGGNRKGPARRYVNLIATMFLGGLWHGASWTFAVWGLLHGIFLVIHHAFEALRRRFGRLERTSVLAVMSATALTYVCVVFGWVFFRAESFSGAINLVLAMGGNGGVALPDAVVSRIPMLEAAIRVLGIRTELGGGGAFAVLWVKLLMLHALVFLLPNTQEILRNFAPALDFEPSRNVGGRRRSLSLSPAWGLAIGTTLALALLAMTRKSEFLYYQF